MTCAYFRPDHCLVERLGESSGGDQSAVHSNALKEHKKNEGMIEAWATFLSISRAQRHAGCQVRCGRLSPLPYPVSERVHNGRPAPLGPVRLRGTVYCHKDACGPGVTIDAAQSHSFNFDHRRRPDTLCTAMAIAFRWPTSTTSRLPRVTPV